MTVEDSFVIVFCLSRIERCIEICAVLQENRLKCGFLLLFKMTTASVIKRFKANGANLMYDYHRAYPEMVWLRLCRITNE